MEIMEILSSRWLEVAVAVYLIGMMLYGHYRGFIKIAVSAMSLFITLFAARVAIPQAAAWLEHNTAVYEEMKRKYTTEPAALMRRWKRWIRQPVSREKPGNARS